MSKIMTENVKILHFLPFYIKILFNSFVKMSKFGITARFLRIVLLDFETLWYYNLIVCDKEVRKLERKFFDEVLIDNYEGNGKVLRLRYYLLISPVGEEFCDILAYGVEIDMHTTLQDGTKEHERKIIRELFFKKSDAKEFLEMISKNVVTPMGLKYAVEEYVEKKMKITDLDTVI